MWLPTYQDGQEEWVFEIRRLTEFLYGDPDPRFEEVYRSAQAYGQSDFGMLVWLYLFKNNLETVAFELN